MRISIVTDVTDDYQQFKKDLGSNIQRIRKESGLTQEQAAYAVEMDRVSIGYIEQGKRAPRMNTLYKLAGVYEVKVRDFFDGLQDEDWHPSSRT